MNTTENNTMTGPVTSIGGGAAAATPLENIIAQVEAEEKEINQLSNRELLDGSSHESGAAVDELAELSLSYDDNKAEEFPAESDSEEAVAEYVFELGEDTQIPEQIHGALGTLAQGLGVPGDSAAKLLNGALETYQKAHREVMLANLGKLKEEWGDKYAANVQATKAFITRIGRKAGLPVEELAPLSCPNGMRLMNALREELAESSAYVGAPATAPKLTVEQQIDAFYADKEKCEAMLNPAHPRFQAVHAELNRLYNI